MKALKRILGNWWVLSIAAALLFAVVLVLLLPLVVPALRPLVWRLSLLGGVVLIWAAIAVWRTLAKRRAARRLEEELAGPQGDPEAAAISARMSAALADLKAQPGTPRDYLYAKPWYVVIGPPGAGKTTALLGSGLRFPASNALQGAGGTRNLDFWFADEAVIVDTAGRFTTQDSSAERDRDGWRGFLGQLRKHRPLLPINGVIVALAVDKLLHSSVTELDQIAVLVRSRLNELHESLEIRSPVYVLFTKTDLLSGFEDFFGDLDVEGRRAVLGATFDLQAAQVGVEGFSRSFDGMLAAIEDRRSSRIQDIRDPRRRALALGFPSQFQALRDRVVRVLDGAFSTSGSMRPVLLRGFYFASGVQSGTPIDALLGSLAPAFDQHASSAPAGGRAYFLNRLLTEVVLGEAGLAQASPEARRRRRTQLLGALGGVAAVVALVLGLWTVSFLANRQYQTRLLAGATDIARQIQQEGIDLAEVRESDPDLEAALAPLRALRGLPGGYADRRARIKPLHMRFGLYQESLARAAEDAYSEGLQRIVLPRVLLRLESYQKQNAADAFKLYEPLKAYLMLGGYHNLDAPTVRAWVISDWQQVSLASADLEDTRKQLGEHLDALLTDKSLGRVWAERQAPIDDSVVQASRTQVGALSMADRAYALLRQRAASSGGSDWVAGEILSTGAAQAFEAPEAFRQLRIPFFYTKTGYEKFYQLQLNDVQRVLKADLWLLGDDQNKAATGAQMQGLKVGVANRYATDYVAAWQSVVAALAPGDYFGNTNAASALLGQPSPLKQMLLVVRTQTTFNGTAADAVGQTALKKLGSAGEAIQKFGPQTPDAGRQITIAFQQLAAYVGDGKGAAPVDDFLLKLRAALDAKRFVDTATGASADTAQIAADQAIAALQGAAQMAPGDLQTFAAKAMVAGNRARDASATSSIGRDYEMGLKPDCVSITESRYPFVRNSKQDAPALDVLRLGQSVDVFRKRVQPYLEVGGVKWRWRLDSPIAATFNPTSAEEFQKAASLQDIMELGIPMKIEKEGLGGAVLSAELTISGVTKEFEPSQPGEQQYQWSRQGVQEARLKLKLRDRTQSSPFTGPWAAFHLFDEARLENAGPTAFKATFGQGAAYATFRVTLNTPVNPFSRGGPWSFRCPATL